MNDYILEFEHLNHKILEYDMKLPDTVLAFKLLDGAGLSEQQRLMASTVASDLKFETMRSALKRIFSNEASADSTVEMDIKKEEDVFVSVKRRDSFKYGQKQREIQYQGSSSFKRSSKLPSAPKLNPVKRRGEVSRCAICDSKMHWVSKCPHKSAKRLQSANVTEENDGVLNESDEESVEDVKLVLLTDDATDCAIFAAEADLWLLALRVLKLLLVSNG